MTIGNKQSANKKSIIKKTSSKNEEVFAYCLLPIAN